MWEKARKIPLQVKNKHPKPPKTKPQKKRTAMTKRNSGHSLFFTISEAYAKPMLAGIAAVLELRFADFTAPP